MTTGGAGGSAVNAADHVAQAEPGGEPEPNVMRCARLTVLPGPSRGRGNLPVDAKVVIGVVLLLVLCSAEVRLNFSLRLARNSHHDGLHLVLLALVLAGSGDDDLSAQNERRVRNRRSPCRVVCGKLPAHAWSG